MAAAPPIPPQLPASDHRVETGLKRRERMKARVIDATRRVFIQRGSQAPVIEDVAREAGISRGTFYQYFRTLEEALLATSSTQSELMVKELGRFTEYLKEPWQRVAVSHRAMVLRAWQDPKWANFFTRIEYWTEATTGPALLHSELQQGKDLGMFDFDDLTATANFVSGATASAMHAFSRHVPDPHAYMDASLRLLMRGLACSPELCEKAVNYSRKHLAQVISGEQQAWAPL